MSLAFARTQDGHPAVQLQHVTYALLPGRTGGLAIYLCYPGKEPALCTAADFSQMSKPVNDETEFQAYIRDLHEHYDQVAALGRVELRRDIATPWGMSQTRTRYCDGIESVSTASHGGFLVDAQMNCAVDERWRATDGAYEEDCAWAVVAHTFPEYFTTRERRQAERTLRSWYPDEFEAITGKTVLPGESETRDRKLFLAANADRYITIAAVNSRKHEGQVECTATIGGERDRKARAFLVPKDEYKIGHGFLIDEARHPALDRNGDPVALTA